MPKSDVFQFFASEAPTIYRFKKNLNINRKFRFLAKFCFGVIQNTQNFEVSITSASCTFFDFDLAKKWQITSNLPIHLLKEVKVPKSEVFVFPANKPAEATYLKKTSLLIANSAC